MRVSGCILSSTWHDLYLHVQSSNLARVSVHALTKSKETGEYGTAFTGSGTRFGHTY